MSSRPRRQHVFAQRAKGRQTNAKPYGLPYQHWNADLQREFTAYRKWRVAKFSLDRPRKLRQRPATFAQTINEFEVFFGYLVNVQGEAPANLRLSCVADPARVQAFVEWHADQRADGPSRYTQMITGTFYTVARYYLKIPSEQWLALSNLRQAIDPDQPRAKQGRMISLRLLDHIGVMERPTRAELRSTTTDFHRQRLALRAQRSLLIRLLTRRPLRSRNVREMQINVNLFHEEAQWMIEFHGDELKVGRRQGQSNIYRIAFPSDLVSQLEEFLEIWRPLLPGHELAHLFTTSFGRPFRKDALNVEIKKLVYAYAGKTMNIHLFRDVWATEYILATQDFVTAAEILGDTVETVLRHYAHLRRANAARDADRFMRKVTRSR